MAGCANKPQESKFRNETTRNANANEVRNTGWGIEFFIGQFGYRKATTGNHRDLRMRGFFATTVSQSQPTFQKLNTIANRPVYLRKCCLYLNLRPNSISIVFRKSNVQRLLPKTLSCFNCLPALDLPRFPAHSAENWHHQCKVLN